MINLLPKNLEEAVAFGLDLLNDESRRELAKIGWVDSHTKYDTDYEGIIGSALGISNRENAALLRDIAVNHSDSLHFLEIDEDMAEPSAAIRVVLAAMSKALLR
jgi:hypothetical protein